MTLTAGGITIIVFAVILLLLLTGLIMYKVFSKKGTMAGIDEDLLPTV